MIAVQVFNKYSQRACFEILIKCEKTWRRRVSFQVDSCLVHLSCEHKAEQVCRMFPKPVVRFGRNPILVTDGRSLQHFNAPYVYIHVIWCHKEPTKK